MCWSFCGQFFKPLTSGFLGYEIVIYNVIFMCFFEFTKLLLQLLNYRIFYKEMLKLLFFT